jgi:hypothetical protein
VGFNSSEMLQNKWSLFKIVVGERSVDGEREDEKEKTIIVIERDRGGRHIHEPLPAIITFLSNDESIKSDPD